MHLYSKTLYLLINEEHTIEDDFLKLCADLHGALGELIHGVHPSEALFGFELLMSLLEFFEIFFEIVVRECFRLLNSEAESHFEFKFI